MVQNKNPNCWDFDTLLKNRHTIKKVFFFRVCGTGMGSAAILLKEKGMMVEGGDNLFYPPMSEYLERSGMALHQISGIDQNFLKQFDLIVVGNVVPKISPDSAMIEASGVPFCSFPTALGALLLCERNVVGIAGTHGKTTTTYLAMQIFEKLGFDAGYMIGGVLDDQPSSKIGKSEYFFIESDEYDSAYFEKVSKFRGYCLRNMILTSLEFDHGDIFPDLESIKDQFRATIGKLKGKVISCSDYPACLDLKKEFDEKNKWLLYGNSSPNGPMVKERSANGTSFVLKLEQRDQLFKTNLVGDHNIANLSSIILFAHAEGINLDKIKKACLDLKLVKRRQEVRGLYREAIVMDDFAHHPRAVEVTIDAVHARFPDKKIHVILDPASATARSNVFQKEFVSALEKAQSVIVLKPERATSMKNTGDLDVELLSKELNAKGVETKAVYQLPMLMNYFDQKAADDVLFLVLSNGTAMGLWKTDFSSRLEKFAH